MSDIRTSQAFAAHRTAVIIDLASCLQAEFVPSYNAEVAHIRKQESDSVELSKSVKSDVTREGMQKLAAHKRDAALLDLHLRRQNFLASLSQKLKISMDEKIKAYGGETFEEMEQRDPQAKPRKVVKVKFPDGSVAKVPQALYIDFTMFDRP